MSLGAEETAAAASTKSTASPEEQVALTAWLGDAGIPPSACGEYAALLAKAGHATLGNLQSALGVDVLRVDATEKGATLDAGKYVAPGVYVGVSQGTEANSTVARVEIDVTDNIVVDTEVGQDSNTGVGVSWSYDF